MDIFFNTPLAPRDPILGLNDVFNADTRKEKVNLGIGVYCDDSGKLPLMRAVHEAEQKYAAAKTPRGYLPIDGTASYRQAVQALLFGADSPLIATERIVTAQSLGGTGAIRIGADLLKYTLPQSKVLISRPSWENHRALFEAAGFEVSEYPYYDPQTHGIDFPGMLNALKQAAPKTIVLLHVCCHNPTGLDLTTSQWEHLVKVMSEKSLIPFLDMAYQGFAEGIEADTYPIRLFAASGLPCFVANSFSKCFSLYGERIGALSVVTANKNEAERVSSQIKRIIRTNYSNPPTHGALLVSTILKDDQLRALWEEELNGMRQRIDTMRHLLAEKLKLAGVPRDFSFIREQRGMFSYSGLTPTQVERLKTDFGIYAVITGRVCIAALNHHNIDAVVHAIGHLYKAA